MNAIMRGSTSFWQGMHSTDAKKPLLDAHGLALPIGMQSTYESAARRRILRRLHVSEKVGAASTKIFRFRMLSRRQLLADRSEHHSIARDA
jgi:hypothetical protein